MVYRCRSLTVEKSVFYRTGGTAVFCFQGYGGEQIGELVFRENSFIDCGHGVGHMGAHGIYVEDHWFELPDDVEGGRPYIRHLSIEGNSFFGDQGPAIYMKGCVGPRVLNNRFITAHAEPLTSRNCTGLTTDAYSQ